MTAIVGIAGKLYRNEQKQAAALKKRGYKINREVTDESFFTYILHLLKVPENIWADPASLLNPAPRVACSSSS